MRCGGFKIPGMTSCGCRGDCGCGPGNGPAFAIPGFSRHGQGVQGWRVVHPPGRGNALARHAEGRRSAAGTPGGNFSRLGSTPAGGGGVGARFHKGHPIVLPASPEDSQAQTGTPPGSPVSAFDASFGRGVGWEPPGTRDGAWNQPQGGGGKPAPHVPGGGMPGLQPLPPPARLEARSMPPPAAPAKALAGCEPSPAGACVAGPWLTGRLPSGTEDRPTAPPGASGGTGGLAFYGVPVLPPPPRPHRGYGQPLRDRPYEPGTPRPGSPVEDSRRRVCTVEFWAAKIRGTLGAACHTWVEIVHCDGSWERWEVIGKKYENPQDQALGTLARNCRGPGQIPGSQYDPWIIGKEEILCPTGAHDAVPCECMSQFPTKYRYRCSYTFTGPNCNTFTYQILNTCDIGSLALKSPGCALGRSWNPLPPNHRWWACDAPSDRHDPAPWRGMGSMK
jgi:hypothetical protein